VLVSGLLTLVRILLKLVKDKLGKNVPNYWFKFVKRIIERKFSANCKKASPNKEFISIIDFYVAGAALSHRFSSIGFLPRSSLVSSCIVNIS